MNNKKSSGEKKIFDKETQKLARMQLFSRYLDLKQKVLDSLDIEDINLLSDCYRVFGINSIQYDIEDLVAQYHIKLL